MMVFSSMTIEVWLAVLYPVVLVLIQLLVPINTRRTYLWLGFATMCTFSIAVTLYLGEITNFFNVLTWLPGAIPIGFAVLRFNGIPFWHRYQRLKNLQSLLGAVDWGLERSQNADTYDALEQVQTSLSFMGFGFSKYLRASPDRRPITDMSDLSRTLLWSKIQSMQSTESKEALRILLANPLAYDVEKYSRQDRQYPQIEDLYFGLDCLRGLSNAFGDMVQVRFYPNSFSYKPSFRLFFFNNTDLYVSFYKWGFSATDLPYLHLRKGAKTFFYPFQTLFEYLWEHGESADIEKLPCSTPPNDG